MKEEIVAIIPINQNPKWEYFMEFKETVPKILSNFIEYRSPIYSHVIISRRKKERK